MMYKLQHWCLCKLDVLGIVILVDKVEQKAQVIIDKIINAGLYAPTEPRWMSDRNYMCCSALDGVNCCVITEEERKFLSDQIKRYLMVYGCITLNSALNRQNLPSRAEDCMDVYKNWCSRPFKKRVT